MPGRERSECLARVRQAFGRFPPRIGGTIGGASGISCLWVVFLCKKLLKVTGMGQLGVASVLTRVQRAKGMSLELFLAPNPFVSCL